MGREKRADSERAIAEWSPRATPTTVFVGHPLRGDIDGNVEKILAICRELHSRAIVPVAPYLAGLRYLRDHIEEERALGIAANLEAFRRRFVDELWLYGPRISPGMEGEVRAAVRYGIPVKAWTPETAAELPPLVCRLHIAREESR